MVYYEPDHKDHQSKECREKKFQQPPFHLQTHPIGPYHGTEINRRCVCNQDGAGA